MTDGSNKALIVRTKLHQPPVPPDFVVRPRLSKILDNYKSRTLTVISAAAGYGKSTLVSGWLHDVDCQNAWITLDESHNDLRVFLKYVVAAVQQFFPNALDETQSLLDVRNLPPATVLNGTLINELDLIEEPFILVLDDIHHIQDDIVYESFDQFINSPPQNFHLMLLGRTPPRVSISKLRAMVRLNEIYGSDLAFTTAETKSFLEYAFHSDIDTDLAGSWRQGSEGWITGLRLATIAFPKNSENGPHRLTPPENRHNSLKYLLQEVLEQQEQSTFKYLLSSAIANRFCAPLCDALFEQAEKEESDGLSGRDFLQYLEESGLFLIALDGQRGWYRYHHLFQQLLIQEAERRYGRQALVDLHLRASEWFESDGGDVTMEDAFTHALTANNTDRAAEIICRYRHSLFNTDNSIIIEKWLSLLPEIIIEGQLELLLCRAWICHLHRNIDLFLPVVDRLERTLSEIIEPESLSGEIATLRGIALVYSNQSAQAQDNLEKALDLIPPSHYLFRGEAELYYAVAGHRNGDTEKVKKQLQLWLNDHPLPQPLRRSLLLGALLSLYIITGDLEKAEQYANRALELAKTNNMPAAISWSNYALGLIFLYRNNLAMAVPLLSQSVDGRFLQHYRGATDTLTSLTLALQMWGRENAATKTLNVMDEFIHSTNTYSLVAVDSCRARLAILRGSRDSVTNMLDIDLSKGPGLMWAYLDNPHITNCRILLSRGSTAELNQALELLCSHAEIAEREQNNCQLIGITALQALAYDKLAEIENAHIFLNRALSIAQPGGFIFQFAELGSQMSRLLKQLLNQKSEHSDFIKIILAMMFEHKHATYSTGRIPTATALHSLDSVLTSREIEIVGLLEQNLYQKEIAEKLFISPETVKSHVKNIYKKLKVNNRRQAVEQAKKAAIAATSS